MKGYTKRHKLTKSTERWLQEHPEAAEEYYLRTHPKVTNLPNIKALTEEGVALHTRITKINFVNDIIEITGYVMPVRKTHITGSQMEFSDRVGGTYRTSKYLEYGDSIYLEHCYKLVEESV